MAMTGCGDAAGNAGADGEDDEDGDDGASNRLIADDELKEGDGRRWCLPVGEAATGNGRQLGGTVSGTCPVHPGLPYSIPCAEADELSLRRNCVF